MIRNMTDSFRITAVAINRKAVRKKIEFRTVPVTLTLTQTSNVSITLF